MKKYQIPALILAAALSLFGGVNASAQNNVAETKNDNEITLGIFAINDFHASFVRNESKHTPGAPALVQTMDSLCRVYPYHIVVNAGDTFGGSYLYSMSREKGLVPQLFRDLNIQISALGNHEFDEGQEKLAAKWKGAELRPDDWNFTYVAANIRNDKGECPSFARPYAVQEIVLPQGQNIKVAFIGLTTSDAPQKTSARNVKGLSFDGNYPKVLDSLKLTPGYDVVEKADLRFILSHLGTAQQGEDAFWIDGNQDNLKKIDDPSIHGLITSHTHEMVASHINARCYPVVQGLSHGNYISMLEVKFDTLTRRVGEITPRLVRIYPKAVLEEKPARLQKQIEETLAQYKTKGGTPLGKPVMHLDAPLEHNRRNKFRQTEVGTLVCQSFAETYRKNEGLSDKALVIGVSHFGSIRAGFPAGDISVLDVGETLPFANDLRVYHMTGKQLFDLVAFGLRNKRFGQIQTSYLSYERDQESGELLRLFYTKGKKPQEVKAKKKYYVVVDDYIVRGGDGYPVSLFPDEVEVKPTHTLPTTTDVFIDYLSNLKQ